METTKRKPGRPPGKEFPAARTLLLTDEDNEALNALADKWECSAAEVVRRLIRREAKRLRIMAKVEQPDVPDEGVVPKVQHGEVPR